jgi:hypothetical protein
MTQFGIIYLPGSYLNSYRSQDQLIRSQTCAKIVHLVSKQLARHWLYNNAECNDEKNPLNNYDEYNNDLTASTMNIIKNSCTDNECSNANSKSEDYTESLIHNEKCFFHKGAINWISYLAFKNVMPEFFDLV